LFFFFLWGGGGGFFFFCVWWGGGVGFFFFFCLGGGWLFFFFFFCFWRVGGGFFFSFFLRITKWNRRPRRPLFFPTPRWCFTPMSSEPSWLFPLPSPPLDDGAAFFFLPPSSTGARFPFPPLFQSLPTNASYIPSLLLSFRVNATISSGSTNPIFFFFSPDRDQGLFPLPPRVITAKFSPPSFSLRYTQNRAPGLSSGRRTAPETTFAL